MADIKIKRKHMGARSEATLTLRVPDPAYDVLKLYDLEIVDYNFINTSTIFASQSGKDIESSNCFGRSESAFNDCVEKLYNSLKGKKKKKKRKKLNK